eukprot:CAMPEP_0206287610 /NCGR_PEP_ID=MMETSP0106_2-20121207/1195_1 /ASSEMBLY_ACC=CAM_ASM_000206 /TAXON_ID=81532 /ORGANISM="Acanthoeca-like sp., Strain 10tr" /LENGTH=443 /DNA_ID=CAMNT_0053718149 /DNA_START=84 /DNA_END=1411 /DNA_ORIENTATION=-
MGVRVALVVLAVASAAPPVVAQNPIEGRTLYINPSYVAELGKSIANSSGSIKETLTQMQSFGSAYWLDVKTKVQPGNTSTDSAAGILADAMTKSPVPLVTFVVYDLPNRDCRAKASNGEICCTPLGDGTCDYGDCSAGLTDYKTNYITPLAATIKQFCGKVPIVLVIEPDSLPNLASNMADPHCGNSATVASYSEGIPFAVQTLAAACPSATQYLDAAHGGWLGWDHNLEPFAQKVNELQVARYLRGFTTNVANYQPLGVACPQVGWCLNNQHQSDPCCADPCRLEGQYNPANNEQNFVQELAAAVSKEIPGFSPHFLIDTGRNGVTAERADCSNWCNIRGAGVGNIPTTETNSTLIDAFMWLKTPGESDGCTATLPDGSQCGRYDSMCGSEDSIGSHPGEPRAPVAGEWFDYQVQQLAAQLAANANLGPVPPGPPPPPPPPP